ncbi:asparagine synthase-related protein [Actinoplanes sp. Pm04-4]|uniref:asparagine synthase (glutamine-hydrolyzing) n=1 Tax=Paractinoplanes pyxinae TaxID=2997416 RepID=A0ABT4BEV6_9ACTN|nr:asparagine synthase-related protein [Actinoplanes pyxinae]MCY1144105.1 asparagine synthase-related protein [Actinoplanes pyxinae]
MTLPIVLDDIRNPMFVRTSELTSDDLTRAGAQYVDERVQCAVYGSGATLIDPHKLAHAWLENGDQALRPVLETAPLVVILADRATGRTVVFRDAMGLGRAYVAAGGDRLWISSTFGRLRAALAENGSNGTLDRDALAAYLTFQYVPYPYTPIREIRQVPPGNSAELAGGEIRFSPIAEPLHASGAHSPDVPEAIRQAGPDIVDLITGSLRRQLKGDETPAMFLSGGMDSSTVGAIAATRLGVRPVAYTATFDNAEYDESAYAAIVAKKFDLDHHFVKVSAEHLNLLPDIARGFDLPHGDRSVLAEHLIAQAAAANGHQIVLSGEGGDELLGHPRTRRPTLFADAPLDPVKLASWYLDRTALTDAPLRERLLGRLGVPHDLPVHHLVAVHGTDVSHHAFDRLLLGQWRTWLVDGVYPKDTQVLLSQGLRPAFPLMDRELARYLAALPADVRQAGLDDKSFLKSALATTLPAETLAKRKHKFLLPFHLWFRGSWAGELRDLLLSERAVVAGAVGADLVGELLDQHAAGTADHDRLLWTIAFFETWWENGATRSFDWAAA